MFAISHPARGFLGFLGAMVGAGRAMRGAEAGVEMRRAAGKRLGGAARAARAAGFFVKDSGGGSWEGAWPTSAETARERTKREEKRSGGGAAHAGGGSGTRNLDEGR